MLIDRLTAGDNRNSPEASWGEGRWGIFCHSIVEKKNINPLNNGGRRTKNILSDFKWTQKEWHWQYVSQVNEINQKIQSQNVPSLFRRMDTSDSVQLYSVDYPGSVVSEKFKPDVPCVDKSELHLRWSRDEAWVLRPTIDMQLCRMISCLALYCWVMGREPLRCLGHSKTEQLTGMNALNFHM